MIARADALAALERDSFDLVVVGGGITGAGVALDAATRGYSVALVERDDYASGTSSRSSKLVHGGLRYLQNFDLGLVREALLERSLMVNLAPHLVKPLPLLVPSFDDKRPDRLMGVGLNMYDVMARRRGRGARDGDEEWSPERHRIVDAEETRYAAARARAARADRRLPLLRLPDRRRATRADRARRGGALRHGDGQRLRGDRARGARRPGAPGVLARDTLGGGEFEIQADNVINATGVWADRLRPDELYAEEEVPADTPEPRHARNRLARDPRGRCRRDRPRRAAGARSSCCPGSAAP